MESFRTHKCHPLTTGRSCPSTQQPHARLPTPRAMHPLTPLRTSPSPSLSPTLTTWSRFSTPCQPRPPPSTASTTRSKRWARWWPTSRPRRPYYRYVTVLPLTLTLTLALPLILPLPLISTYSARAAVARRGPAGSPLHQHHNFRGVHQPLCARPRPGRTLQRLHAGLRPPLRPIQHHIPSLFLSPARRFDAACRRNFWSHRFPPAIAHRTISAGGGAGHARRRRRIQPDCLGEHDDDA